MSYDPAHTPSEDYIANINEELLIDVHNNTPNNIITVIGVGGGGGNAVGNMYLSDISDVNFLVCNTDKKALDSSPVPDRLQLGPGLGVGGQPHKGREIAEEHIEKIREILTDNIKILFITAGMGGGTGTGVSPILAEEARKKGILTIAIVTIPFAFEMPKRIDMALDGIEVLSKHVDALLIVNNERLKQIYADLSIINAFKKADDTLLQAVRSIVEIIKMRGTWIMDFNDVSNCLRDGGVAIMSTGYGEGEQRVSQAIHNAIHSPLLNDNDVYKASKLLMHITMPDEGKYTFKTEEFNEIEKFTNKFSKDIETKFGFSIDNSLDKKIKITILASGYTLNDSRPQKINKVITEEEKNKIERRKKAYGFDAPQNTYIPRHYLFGTEDLDNEELVELLEQTPSYKRSKEQLEAIERLSLPDSAVSEPYVNI